MVPKAPPTEGRLQEGAPHDSPATATLTHYSHRKESAVLCLPPSLYLLGTAVKLENTYLAIMSRQVSVSSVRRP